MVAKRKVFLFSCRDVYWVYYRTSPISYGFYNGDGADVVVARSVKAGLKLLAKVDKEVGLPDIELQRVPSLNNGDYKHFVAAVQSGDCIKEAY